MTRRVKWGGQLNGCVRFTKPQNVGHVVAHFVCRVAHPIIITPLLISCHFEALKNIRFDNYCHRCRPVKSNIYTRITELFVAGDAVMESILRSKINSERF